MARQPIRNFLRMALGVLLCLGALVLCGCVHATKPAFMQHYDLGSPPASGPGGATAHRGDGVLQIARISVPGWLDGTGMYYRLRYRHDDSLAAYADSDWVTPPATLLEPVIQDTLVARGRWRAVIGPRNPASADASLHLRLDDFSQAFASPGDSSGVIDASATLVDNHTGGVLAQRHFHVEVAAPTPDAQGGVKALSAAGRQLAGELQRWLATIAVPG